MNDFFLIAQRKRDEDARNVDDDEPKDQIRGSGLKRGREEEEWLRPRPTNPPKAVENINTNQLAPMMKNNWSKGITIIIIAGNTNR